VIARYCRLTPAERRIVRHAALIVLGARLLVRRVSVSWLRGQARRLAQRSSLKAERLLNLVEAVAAVIPGTTPCLARAIALEAVLVGAGHAAELRIGVAPREGRDRLAAHAWVELDGVPLEQGTSRYVALPLFGAAG
jgi:hypothetical protein